MKKLNILLITIFCSFAFIIGVKASEVELDNIAAVNIQEVGGSNKEIIQIDSNNTYQYYYKYVKIKNNAFIDYIKNKKIVDNSTDGSDNYINAAKKVGDYEIAFFALIPTVNRATDVSGWTKSVNNEIAISNLAYASGQHNGYVLAVAAVKNGDDNVYISRIILESKSASTLGQISYDDTNISTADVNKEVVKSKKTVVKKKTVVNNADQKTKNNPNTGINDYALYLAPLSIVLGSVILLRKSYA